MIDFTLCERKNKTYGGANGNKISIVYNNELYMLKFPGHVKRNHDMSYSNGCISEYIGCKIFNSVGIAAQETLLGTYSINGKEKIVVACKDLTSPGVVMQDFASLKNTIIDSERNGYGTELSDIIQTIESQTIIDAQGLRDAFWDMFVVDAFIGNWDRHNGNWGFLYNSITDTMSLAPIYDCGSCMFPQADNEIMRNVLEDAAEKDLRTFVIPTSAIKIDGQKINYFDFISSCQNKECNQAIKRIVPKINMEKINEIINNIPYISDLQKEFYKTMLSARKERILDFAYEKINALEQNVSFEDATKKAIAKANENKNKSHNICKNVQIEH